MVRTKRGWLVAAVILGLSAITLTIGVGAGTSSTTTASCYPHVYTPYVYTSTRRGYAAGWVGCDSASLSWCYTIKMVNRAGSALITSSGCYGGTTDVVGVATPVVGCAGAWVHTFLYINVNGQGKSNTSGDKYC
jgi:hypothetical protein